MLIVFVFALLVVTVSSFNLGIKNAAGPVHPLEDPLQIMNRFPVNMTLDPFLKLNEDSFIENVHINGLSSIHYNVSIIFLQVTALFDLNIGSVEGNATYSASGYVNALPFREETVPSGNATLKVNLVGNYIELSSLNLNQVMFDSISINFGEKLEIKQKKIDWDKWSANFKENFDKDFVENRKKIACTIRTAVNKSIGKISLSELTKVVGGGLK